jgi:opacity protein-like surface antigen
MKRLLAVVVIMLAVTAVSSAQLAFRGIGGAVGFVTSSLQTDNGSESMSGFAIAAHADLGEFTKDFTFVPDIMYWTMSKDVSVAGLGNLSLKLSDFAINANAHYNIAMEGMLKPYVGAGLGYNSFSSTTSTPAVTIPGFGTIPGQTITGSKGQLGINLLAGVNYKLNDMLSLVIEPRYVLSSDFNHFIIKAGVTYAMK